MAAQFCAATAFLYDFKLIKRGPIKRVLSQAMQQLFHFIFFSANKAEYSAIKCTS